MEGRLEYVDGRLEYMPPCGEMQQRIVVDVVFELATWARRVGGYVVGTNEAGMRLGRDTRAADVAVWRAVNRPASSGFAREAPILAVEVTGQDDAVDSLALKAQWYLDHGVEVVWIVDADARRVEVITLDARHTVDGEACIPPHASLDGLSPRVSDFFRQL